MVGQFKMLTESPSRRRTNNSLTFREELAMRCHMHGLLPHRNLTGLRGERKPTARSATPERAQLQEALRIRRQERLLTLAGYCGIAGSLTASAFLVITGRLGLLAVSIFLCGFSSLVPEIIDLRRSRRLVAESDRNVSPVIGPDIRQSLGIDREPAARPMPEWHSSQIDDANHTIH